MPDSALRERILAEVARRPSPTRHQQFLNSIVLALSGAAITLVAFWIHGGVRPTGRPSAVMVGTALGALVIATVAVAIGVRRGRSMCGRSLATLLTLVVTTPMALLVWKIVWSSHFPGMTRIWPDRVGFRCFWLGLSMMIGPLLASAIARRHGAVNHRIADGAALGTAVGAIVWVFVDLWCPVAYAPHLLLGHVLPLLLSIGAGAVLGCCVFGLSRSYLPRD